MSAFQSLINNYKNVRKPKVFAKLRGEGSGTSHTTNITQPGNADIIEIKENGPRYSLDFDGGKPDTYESDILDAPVRPRGDGQTGSPQVKLDIDLAPEALTDWFAANFPRQEAQPMPFLEDETLSSQRSRNMSQGVIPDPTAFNGHTRLVTGDADEEDELARSSEEALANLQAMDASHFGSLPGFSEDKRASPVIKKQTPSPLSIPLASPDLPSAGRKHPRDSISMLTSNLSLEESSSAVSGTTLARALFSNTFSLSSDSRSSRYRSGGAGLTRSDSTTLGRGYSFYDTFNFAVDPDAPPMPAHAESQYEAPKKSRRRHQRRSSTGSLHMKALVDTPSGTRPNSLLLSPASEFDILRSPDPWTPPPVPSIPRSPPPSSPLLPPPTIQAHHPPLTSSSPDLKLESDSPEQVDALIPVSYQQTSPEDSRWSVPSFAPSTDSQTSSRSADDVLGYYGVPDSYDLESPLLLPGATYRPAVSPIREETSSQLSPPTPYKSDRRDSRRMLPFGARSPGKRLSMARSESSTPPGRPLEATTTSSRQILPPLTEDVSTSQTQPDSARSSLEVLPLNHRTELFNRQRSGSAPTPSLIERSFSDPASLTSLQHPANEVDTFAKQDNRDHAEMLISAMSSSTIAHDPSAALLAMQLRSSSQPNLAQHLLVGRTGSTGRNSKQLSGGRVRPTVAGGRPGSPSRRRIGEISESSGTYPLNEPEHLNEDPQQRSDERAVTGDEISRSSSRGTVSDGSSLHVSDSSRTKMKSLPRIPVSPIGIPLINGDLSSPEPSASSSTHGSITQPSQVTSVPAPQLNSRPPITDTPQLRPRAPPNITIPEGSTAPSTTTQPNISHYPTTHSPILSSQEIELTGGIPPHLRQYKDDAFGTYRGLSLGSPPPYYSVINEPSLPPQQPLQPATPNSGSADQAQTSTPGPSSATQEWSQNDTRLSTRDSRARPRPPLPAGPRRPSQQMPPPVSNSLFGPRDRSASVSSSAGAQPVAGPSRPPLIQSPVAGISPKFQTPPPRWRGYTMEAAKWTFTSTELQAVVSRAIRQSAQASSIRLLQPDVLDHHVPQELRNLEARRTEVKTRYKVLTRRRSLLFEALSAHISGAADEDPAYAQRLLEDLREMAVTLDKLSEELYNMDGQISHLESLVQTHTSSALAIALRKLNTSFLKQMAQNQDLEGQLRDVEAERNEAWTQAQWVADELDQMADVMEESPVSNRSSRVGANRKSSARQSKALLRSSRRFSQLSAYSFSSLPSSKSPVGRQDRIPPVPALPTLQRRNPPDGFMESPTSPFSTGFTPNSETRAQHQVQAEVYAMLGLSVPTLHRSRSWNGLASPPATADPTKAPTVWPVQTLEAQTASVSRRSSLPPDSTLAQVYNTMSAERNAMLLTADMLASTD
ncbi:hypothetical protein CPB83DRAFT_850596 [Crepidotus variabilis]|uniref:Uncharacterized protein n=1 Tax=Crepidotus variabilis TaxID=179855 RepID=A0A9P6EKI8_9AGAR|nr:hypothetical protein CPB83DRAFT_850596 [Crepidotus variabilis]